MNGASYNIIIKLDEVSGLPADVLSKLEKITVQSKTFHDAQAAALSASTFLSDVAEWLSTSDKKYTIMSEINPRISNTKTTSTDWEENELFKIWVYDAAAILGTGQRIIAVALARIWQVKIETYHTIN